MSATAKTTYFFRSALQGIWRQPFVHAIAILTLTIALFAAGLTRAVDNLAQELLRSLEARVRVTAYLDPALTDEAQTTLAGAIQEHLATPVLLVTPAMAMSRLASEIPELGGALEHLKDNPLSPSLELDVPDGWREPGRLEGLASQLRGVEGVTAVDYGEEAVQRLSAIARGLRLGGLIGFLVVLAATIVIVAATLQLAIFARRTEIEIQKLVGATDRFVKIPFLLEGLIQGVLGAGLALLALATLLVVAGPRLQSLFSFWMVSSAPALLTPTLCLEVLAGGVVLGLAGSAIAVGRFLRT